MLFVSEHLLEAWKEYLNLRKTSGIKIPLKIILAENSAVRGANVSLFINFSSVEQIINF